jgi:hypothetical protein
LTERMKSMSRPRKIPICYGSDYNEDIISKGTGFPLEAT